MKFSKPIATRYKLTHLAHLKRRAAEQGHGIMVLVLREIIEQDMRARAKRPHHKSRAA